LRRQPVRPARKRLPGRTNAGRILPSKFRQRGNGQPLDGSRHTYTLTFPVGQLPPVNAFWSVTIYDGKTQLLLENPVNRYLINPPMLPGMKTSPDGSLTIYIQKGPTRKGRRIQLAARSGRPDFSGDATLLAKRGAALDPGAVTMAPLAFAGEGRVDPFTLANRTAAKSFERFGNLSLGAVIRTDERYGSDRLFQGPRGWDYWDHCRIRGPARTRICGPTNARPTLLGSS
jgi:hypothetical protein